MLDCLVTRQTSNAMTSYLSSGSKIPHFWVWNFVPMLFSFIFCHIDSFVLVENEIGNAQVENSRGGSLFKTFVLTVLEFRVKNVSNRKRSKSSFEPFRIPKIPNGTKFKSLFICTNKIIRILIQGSIL